MQRHTWIPRPQPASERPRTVVALQSESSMQVVQFAAFSTSIRGCGSVALPYLHRKIIMRPKYATHVKSECIYTINVVWTRYAPIVAPFAAWTRSPTLFDTPSDRPLPARHRSPRRSSS